MKQYWPKLRSLVSFAAATAARDYDVRSRTELASLGIITPNTYIKFLVAEAQRLASPGNTLPIDLPPANDDSIMLRASTYDVTFQSIPCEFAIHKSSMAFKHRTFRSQKLWQLLSIVHETLVEQIILDRYPAIQMLTSLAYLS